jgi:prepilin-type N-terminal cleavage/methylation domain-containing protein
MGRNQDGFTILELLVVVAIIGVLATIVYPGYYKYLSKARQAEARLELGGAFIAEKGYVAEWGTYTACLAEAGYAPLPLATKYYSVGIVTIPAASCGPNGGQDCQFYTWSAGGVSCGAVPDAWSAANVTAFQGATIFANDVNFEACVTGTNVGKDSFIIGACGNVNGVAAIYDGWTVNENKIMTNTASGL